MERIYNKLVRDKIPNIIKDKKETPVVRILDDKEYQEVIEASGEDRVEELADMLEIIKALAKLENETLDNVIEIANKKVDKRGAFEEKIFLEKVIE